MKGANDDTIDSEALLEKRAQVKCLGEGQRRPHRIFGELFDVVASSGGLSEEQARDYFRQILLAVEYCHAQGVYHRDMKLENVLRDSHGALKVATAPFRSNILYRILGGRMVLVQ